MTRRVEIVFRLRGSEDHLAVQMDFEDGRPAELIARSLVKKARYCMEEVVDRPVAPGELELVRAGS